MYSAMFAREPSFLRLHSRLVLETPSRIIVTAPILQLAHFLDLGGDAIPLCILPLQNEVQSAGNEHIRNQVAQREAVPKDIPRSIVGSVQLRSQHGTAISNRDLHGVRNGSFCLSAHVDGRPRKCERCRGVDATCRKECAQVGNTRASRGVGVCEQDDVADSAKGCGASDEWGALVGAFGQRGYGEGGYEGECVWWDRKKLGVCCSVAKGLNDAWLDLWISILRSSRMGSGQKNQLTTNSENVYSGKDMVWKANPYSQHLGSLIARNTLLHVNRSS